MTAKVERNDGAPNVLKLLRFGGAVLIAGANLVAVSFTSAEMPPFLVAGSDSALPEAC